MFFSRKPTSLILIEREKVMLYPKRKVPPLGLPTELVEYLEVKDAARLSAAMADFVKKNTLAQERVIVLLDRSILFQKAVNLAQVKDTAAARADFESKVPFNPEDRQLLSIQQKEYEFLFGVNKSFYSAIVAGILQTGAKVAAVVPAVVYGITDSDKLTPTKLDQILHTTGLTQSANFLERT